MTTPEQIGLRSVVFLLAFACEVSSPPPAKDERMMEPVEVLERGYSVQPNSFALEAVPRAEASKPLSRLDLVVETTVQDAFGGREGLLSQLDDALLPRLDLYVQAVRGAKISTWTDDDGLLQVAALGLRSGSLSIARGEDGRFYDGDGFGLVSDLAARPLPVSRITSRFGDRLHPVTMKANAHRGIDYGARTGTPVRAVHSGSVQRAANSKSAGNFIVLVSPKYRTKYLHLDRISDGVRTGAEVSKGDVIGFVGSTGSSTGPHLHFELYLDGRLHDPTRFIPLPGSALGPAGRDRVRSRIQTAISAPADDEASPR